MFHILDQLARTFSDRRYREGNLRLDAALNNISQACVFLTERNI